jgi:hypothetical protein
LNTTKKEGDGNKLPFSFSLQQHHKRRRWHIAIIFFFFATPPQKKTIANCRRLLILKHKEDKTHKKTTKKTKKREGVYFQAPLLTFGFRFCLLVFALLFQTFSPGIFFFSRRRKEKKNKKKNHREKKKCKGRRSLPSSSRFALSLLVPIFALSFQALSP